MRQFNGSTIVIWLLSGLVSTTFSAPVLAQSSYPFVADDFEIPEMVETHDFRLRMITVNDTVKDYDAVMSSVAHLENVWPGSGWPGELTIEEDLVALGWHQQEFWYRTSFAYTVVTLDESQVIGCVYINPTRKRGYDAEVYLWVRESELEHGTDAKLQETVEHWLHRKWKFDNVAFPGRKISWDEWEALPDEKR